MTTTPQRAAFVAAQVETIHRSLRLLEHVVGGPIGLTTDLLSLRQALAVPQAGEERDRVAFQDIGKPVSTALRAGLDAYRVIVAAMDLLSKTVPAGEDPLAPEWRERAGKVLERVASRLGGDLRQDVARAMAGVYVIVDPEHTHGKSVVRIATAALRGGAVAIQYRDKNSSRSKLISNATEVGALCKGSGAVFIVNDHVDVALVSGADGLHVGQKDISVQEARNVLGARVVIGKSNALLQEALESEAEGADYVAVGAMFTSSTKTDTRPAGLAVLREVKRSVAVPVVAIGGINDTNVVQVVKAGANTVCVASAITRASDPGEATRRLVDLFNSASAP